MLISKLEPQRRCYVSDRYSPDSSIGTARHVVRDHEEHATVTGTMKTGLGGR